MRGNNRAIEQPMGIDMEVKPVDFGEVNGDVQFMNNMGNILDWIDGKMHTASNVHKSYLSFAKRAILNSGYDLNDYNGLAHSMRVRQIGLADVGAYSLYSKFNNTISIINDYKRLKMRGEV